MNNRPRRIALVGSDGESYEFLLKAHEDLRQDERVMQLFALVNRLCSESYTARQQRLGIQVWKRRDGLGLYNVVCTV